MSENQVEEKKGWSWLGFFFAPHYYAGYGNLKIGIIIAVIGGIMPLFSIFTGIYGGMKAKKELPIGEQEFKWANVGITVVIIIVVSIISQMIIASLKG
ncbi:MAG: hypothetical protein M0R46_17925 [Candidatus Muirbacterium halophilum]|nr:hypothetical protein [Candidatus Muirbacterium halophilum]